MEMPNPIDYKRIWLTDHSDRGEAISYTDCMESSTLRFVQAMLCDLSSLKKSGRPTMVDMNLARARVQDAAVLAFLEAHPNILPADAYNSGDGYAARTEWARLMNNKPFFTYKRSSTGVYKNDAITGQVATPPQGYLWRLEMEPCIHNIVAVCRHFLGCNLEAADRQLARREAAASDASAVPQCAVGAVPFAESFGEAHAADVTAAARAHVDYALSQLCRPGMELQGRLCVEFPPREAGFSERFQSCLDLHLNGEPVWRWALSRTSQFGPYLVPPYDKGYARDGDGAPIFVTSAHSHIEVWDAASGDWEA